MTRIAGAREFKAWQGLCVLGATAIAVVVAAILRLDEKWRDAFVFTVLVFSAAILAVRVAWNRRVFWRNVLLLFVLHALAVTAIAQALPPNYGVPGLALTAVAMVESVLLTGILWRTAASSGSTS